VSSGSYLVLRPFDFLRSPLSLLTQIYTYKMGSQKLGKKRDNTSVFDTIEDLELEDAQFGALRRKKSNKQARRGQAAQSQTKIYNHLVECRILLQRAVTATNIQEDEQESFQDGCNALLENLLKARQNLTVGSIPDQEEEEEGNEYSDMVRMTSSGQELQETLQQEYEQCREQWKQVLDQRHKDLKLHAGLTAKSQFRVLDSSFWEQVDAAVEYEGLRKKKGTNENDDPEDSILDDSKVYQHLLKDFVAHSTTKDGTTTTGGTDRLKKLSKSPQNMKKENVDRRASKGRKIRYKEIPKLVNFTFPLSRPNSTSGLDQDEWFKSLFGGAGKI